MQANRQVFILCIPTCVCLCFRRPRYCYPCVSAYVVVKARLAVHIKPTSTDHDECVPLEFSLTPPAETAKCPMSVLKALRIHKNSCQNSQLEMMA